MTVAMTPAEVVLYPDRICIPEIAEPDEFGSDLVLSETQTGAILSDFFFSSVSGRYWPAGFPVNTGHVQRWFCTFASDRFAWPRPD